MKKITVDKLTSGQIQDLFAVVFAERRTTKTNKSFLRLAFADATGEVPGVAWDNVDKLENILVPGKIVNLTAEVNQYDNKPQLNVKSARAIDENDKIEAADFKPKTPYDITYLYSQVVELIASINDPMVKQLVDVFFDDPKFVDKYCQHTAAKRVHHAYAGGLIEHSLSVTKTALSIRQNYDYINRDLVIAGGLLHDIGKMYEMAGDLTTEYTMVGSLVGHIPLGSEMIGQAAAQIPNFPEALKWQLQHLILSHHGKLEFGSPVLPTTMEAIVLNFADMIDSQLFQVVAAIEENNDKEAEFTKRIFGLDRKMLLQPTIPAKSSDVAPMESNDLLDDFESPLQDKLL